MILLIDNYDSFSYNLVQLIGEINSDIKVVRNDELCVKEIDELQPEAIIISPGPGRPSEAGVCIDVIKELGSKYKILGVCLGHQSICEAFGTKIVSAFLAPPQFAVDIILLFPTHFKITKIASIGIIFNRISHFAFLSTTL